MHRRSSVQIALTLFLIVVCSAGVARADGQGRAQFVASFAWQMNKPWFGGWSGIEISPDGTQMTAITDRGRLIRADVHRTNGQITGIAPRKWWRLKASTGRVLTKQITDSEGLALDSAGRIHISFEGITRVARYHPPGGAASVLPSHKAFKTFPRNGSLEALAIDAQNRLFTIPEKLYKTDRMQIYAVQNGTFALKFGLSGGDGFLPVGADFDAQGRLYVLERGWNIFGFRTRVRRWDMSEDGPANEQLLLQTETGTHDNLEGLAVWQDEAGRTRITMISDDNFLWLQRTEIVEYSVRD